MVTIWGEVHVTCWLSVTSISQAPKTPHPTNKIIQVILLNFVRPLPRVVTLSTKVWRHPGVTLVIPLSSDIHYYALLRSWCDRLRGSTQSWIKPEECKWHSGSHQDFEVGQVDVAVLVHLHHLNLHASHLSTRWVGAMGRLGNQTDLEWKEKMSGWSLKLILSMKKLRRICSLMLHFSLCKNNIVLFYIVQKWNQKKSWAHILKP